MQNINWLHSRKQGSYDCIKKNWQTNTKMSWNKKERIPVKNGNSQAKWLLDSEWNPISCGCDKVFIETLSKNTSFSEYSCRWVMLYLSLHDKKISQLNRLRKSTFYLLNIRHNSKLQTEILTSEANAIFNFVFIIELVLKKQKQINI